MLRILTAFLVLLLAGEASATTIYVDINLVANCPGSTYSIASRNCTGSDGKGFSTFLSAIPTLLAGDTMYVRGGLYTERMNFQDAGITGASGNYITVAGYPGETVTLRTTSSSTGSYGPIKIRGAGFGWFVFRNLTLDGSAETDNTIWQIRDGNHDFILEDLILENFASSSILISASNITVRRCILRNTRNISASSFYGMYLSSGTNVTVEDSQLYNNGGGGIHMYPGPHSNVIIRRNRIHDNNSRTGSNLPVGGIAIYESPTVGGAISGVSIYDNLIYNNGTISGVGNGGSGVYLGGSTSADGPSGTEIYNNTIYGQNGGVAGMSWGVRIVTSGTSGTIVKNNIITNNQHGQVSDSGTSSTISYNACLSGDSCGSTGKVTLGSNTACFISSSDFRHPQGTDPCRDAGTSVSTRSAPVGTTDLGPYEQGKLDSASVVSGVIEGIVSAATASVIPTSGITGFTVACAGGSPCTGTPTVSSVSVKGGSGSTLQIHLAGLITPGTCTLSIGATNLTDMNPIGGSTQVAQGINSASGTSISGNCITSAAGSAFNFVWQ